MFIIDKQSQFPLYMQLYTQIKSGIHNKSLISGHKIPSIRKLSSELGISKNTVENAYALLLLEGLIINKPGSGYYVTHNLSKTNLAELSADKSATAPIIQVPPAKACHKEDSAFRYDFTVNSRIPDELPFAEWQKLTNKCLREYQYEFSCYRRNAGELGLRREILKYLKAYHNVNCTVDHIVVDAGVHNCLIAISHLLEDMQPFTIAMENPGSTSVKRNFMRHGANIHLIPLDTHGINIKKLKLSGAKTAFLTPSCQYPTGIIMPPSRRLELIEWAKSENGMIIENDYSQPFRHSVGSIPSLQSLDPDKVIYLSTFTNALFPSMGIAYMVLPQKLSAKYHLSFSEQPTSASFLTQKTLEFFMKEGYWEAHLRRFHRKLKKKRDCLLECLEREFGDAITVYGVNAGFQIMLQTHWQGTEEELIAKAHHAGIGITPSSIYCFFPTDSNMQGKMIVLNYCGIRLEDISAGVKLLRKVWLSP